MAQKKKRKPQKTQTGQVSGKKAIRLFEAAAQDANRIAEEKTGYEHRLGIPDASEIREIEASIEDPYLKYAFRCGMLANLKSIPNPYYNATSARNAELIIRTGTDSIRASLINAVSTSIADLLVPPEKMPPIPDQDRLFDMLEIIETNLIPKFHENNGDRQCRRHLRHQMANPLATGIHDVVDWKKMFKGPDIDVWCRSALELYRSVISEDRLAEVEKAKTKIAVAMAKFIREIIKKSGPNARNDMIRMGYSFDDMDRTAGKNPDANSIGRPSLMAAVGPNVLRMKMPKSKPLPEDVMPSMLYEKPPAEPARPPLFAIVAGLEVIKRDYFQPIAKALFETVSFAELVYAAVSWLAGSSGSSPADPVADATMTAVLSKKIMTKADQDYIQKGWTELDSNSIVIDPYAPLEYRPEALRHTEDLKARDPLAHKQRRDPSKPLLNIWQYVMLNTDASVPSRIIISGGIIRQLQDMGLPEREACAMAGYVQGLASGRMHTIMTDIYMPDDKKSETDKSEDDVPVPDLSISEDEMQAHMAEADRKAEERIEMERRKALKAQKLARYETAGLEVKLQAALDEAEALQLRAKRAEAEVNRLRDEMAELAMRIPSEPEGDLGGDKEEDAGYPDERIGTGVKIVVYGGSQNWVKEQKNRFPNVNFYGADVQPNETACGWADIVMINTFVNSHKKFWQARSACRKSGKEPVLFPKPGINNCSAYIRETYDRYLEENQI